MNKRASFNQGLSVIRHFSGGSSASTILCTDGINTFYRKYAFGESAKKLYGQIEWINKYSSVVPLPRIIRSEYNNNYCYYDMSYVSHSVDLFEYSHSMRVEQTWNILTSLLDLLQRTIYEQDKRTSDEEDIQHYVQTKIQKNLSFLKASSLIAEYLSYDTMIINGKEYNNLHHYEKCLSEENLKQIFSQDAYSVLHGDLTFENIICTRNSSGKEDFYVIDPNVNNTHDSCFLDYAKILQSVHGEYELIKSSEIIDSRKNELNYSYTHSAVYEELFELFDKYLRLKFSYESVRSIYYHEIVHWLRLIPYKMTSDPERFPVFYAQLLILLDNLVTTFDEEGKLE